MRIALALCLLPAVLFAVPDLVAPFKIKQLSSMSSVVDSIEITSYLNNEGTTTALSPLYPTQYTAFAVGLDSFSVLRLHSAVSLSVGSFLTFKDTMSVLKGPFALYTWADPLKAWGEDGFGVGNNVWGCSFNFHPEIHYDTVTILLLDTLLDTLTIHDTITVRDTIHDTLQKTPLRKIAHPTQPQAPAELYSMDGRRLWGGPLAQGNLPRLRLSAGSYVLACGDRRQLLLVRQKSSIPAPHE